MTSLKKTFAGLLAVLVWAYASDRGWADTPLSEENHHLLTLAYSLSDSGQDRRAADLLHQGLASQPSEYRMNLLMAQIMERGKNYDAVKRYATAALKDRPGDSLALAMRGFAAQHLGERQQARSDFRAALKGARITPEKKENIRAALENLDTGDALAKAARAEKDITSTIAHSPAALLTTGEQLFRTAEDMWSKGYYADADKQYALAAGQLKSPFLLSESYWKRAQHHSREGNFLSALKYGRKSADYLPESAVRHFDLAYLCLANDRDREATLHFEQGLKYWDGTLGGGALLLDTAYAYKRLNEKDKLLYYLEKTINYEWERRDSSGFTEEDIARLYYARREHSYLTREWGAYTSWQYHRTQGDYLWQGIQEFYWQIYNANGQKIQLFSQIGGVTMAGNRDLVGGTTYANFGLRVFPFPQWNLVFTLEQIVKIGDLMRDEPRMRIGYSWDHGLDIDPIRASWTYASLFAEATYSFRYDEAFFTGEFRYGRSFKLFGWDKTILSPHLFFYCDSYSEALERKDKWRNYAGPGIHLRQWYREDKYNAPQSYFDVTLQYRINFRDPAYNALVLSFFHSF